MVKIGVFYFWITFFGSRDIQVFVKKMDDVKMIASDCNESQNWEYLWKYRMGVVQSWQE